MKSTSSVLSVANISTLCSWLDLALRWLILLKHHLAHNDPCDHLYISSRAQRAQKERRMQDSNLRSRRNKISSLAR
ncbi:hypothetical protein CC86DRAFT_371691 [Ophiobolus disseminans]|uniref:Uncharacterized protein n=1 Tax=Ophiobolus disseminans TaxID=1469910 RepID=A0A6A6ZUA9_9PLEO|nr:hypothetical protein CC86DRAFT_371691 [Ophiobolus disseminans]